MTHPTVAAGFLLVSSVLLVRLPAQRTADEALAALRAGNARFVQAKSMLRTTDSAARTRLAEGQRPFAVVLSCADSCVPPEHVFDVGLGELFTIRVAGNVCDPEVVASIEYAAEHLGVRLGVVLGHEGCGAVKACLQQAEHGDHEPGPALHSLLQRIEPALQRAKLSQPADLLEAAETENAYQAIGDCLHRSETLRRLVTQGKFTLRPARYRLATGAVDWLPERPLAGAPLARRGVRAPHEVLQLLQEGHRRYLSASTPLADVSVERRQELCAGQKPSAVVVTCADSRVSPEILFDAGLGELFVVRVAGNVLNDTVQASIEYALEHTGAALVLVLGHSRCGAVTAAAEHGGHDHGPNLTQLVHRIAPAVERARASGLGGEALVARAIELNVLGVVGDLRARSEAVRKAEHTGRLALVGAVYQLESGELKWLPVESQ